MLACILGLHADPATRTLVFSVKEENEKEPTKNGSLRVERRGGT